MAILTLYFHISLYLIERHMPWTFDHHLHIFFPCSQRQFAQNFQLRKLCVVTRIIETTRTQAITERKCHIILSANIQDLVIRIKERILFMIVHHPRCHQRSAARDDSHLSFCHMRHKTQKETCMDREITHALLCLFLQYIQHRFDRQIFDLVMTVMKDLIHRYRTDRYSRMLDHRCSDLVQISAGTEIHDRICAILQADIDLFDLTLHIGCQCRRSDIGIDLTGRSHPDRHWYLMCMVDIRRDDASSSGNLGSQQLRVNFFYLCHMRHLFCNDALFGIIHLSSYFVICSFFQPFSSHLFILRIGVIPIES